MLFDRDYSFEDLAFIVSLFTLPYKVWSSIEIEHEKSGFFASFFRNISKTVKTILIKKKNWAKPWHFGLQKSPNK